MSTLQNDYLRQKNTYILFLFIKLSHLCIVKQQNNTILWHITKFLWVYLLSLQLMLPHISLIMIAVLMYVYQNCSYIAFCSFTALIFIATLTRAVDTLFTNCANFL